MIIGVITAMVIFARRVAHLTEVIDVAHPDEDTRVYAVRGELFFASSNDLIYQSTTPATRRTLSSICPSLMSGTRRPSRHWTPSPPSTRPEARMSRSWGSTTHRPSATCACPVAWVTVTESMEAKREESGSDV